MNITASRRAFLLGASACALQACATGRGENLTAIVGGMVIDPSGDAPHRRADVILDGARITAVGRAPRGARVIDATGKFICPGLWDMHAHIATDLPVGRAPENYVGWGVLGIRDCGGDLAALQAVRTEVAGDRIGPDMFIAGPTLNGQSFGHWHRVIANEAEARAAVRELHSQVDFFKTHRATSREAFFALVDEAARFNKHVAGHVPLAVTWDEAVAAGMLSFEHTQTLAENEVSAGANRAASIEDAVARLQGPRLDEIMRSLAARGRYFDPTLIQYEESINARPEIAERRRMLYAILKTWVLRAHRAGVTLLAGSDMLDRFGEMLLLELERLVECGLTPREALRAATTNPGRLMRRAGEGGITAGAAASFLILDADPDADIRNLRRLSSVVLRGRVIETAELAALRQP